jgi:hypothetical protein
MNLLARSLLDSNSRNHFRDPALSLAGTLGPLIHGPEIGLGLFLFQLELAQGNPVHVIRKHVLLMQRDAPLFLLGTLLLFLEPFFQQLDEPFLQ